jgi:hypothetical protein
MPDAKMSRAIAAAKKGDVEAIQALFKRGYDAKADQYRYLVLGGDQGFDACKKAARALRDKTTDEDELADLGLAHLDLGEWYLVGKNGIAVDLKRGRAHLTEAKAMLDFEMVVESFQRSRRRLKPDAAAVLDAIFPAKAKARQ